MSLPVSLSRKSTPLVRYTNRSPYSSRSRSATSLCTSEPRYCHSRHDSLATAPHWSCVRLESSPGSPSSSTTCWATSARRDGRRGGGPGGRVGQLGTGRQERDLGWPGVGDGLLDRREGLV